MTRSRFGFQTALLAGCLSLLAVGCGDDGGTTAMTPDNGGDKPDPCAGLSNPQSSNSACPNYEAPEPPPAPKPVFGLSEDHLLDTNELQISGNEALVKAGGDPGGNSGTSSPFTFQGLSQRGVGGIQVVNHRPAATATGAPFIVPRLRNLMRNDDGDLTYNLDFFRYKNVNKSPADNDRNDNDNVALRFDYGTYGDQTPDMLVDNLGSTEVDSKADTVTTDAFRLQQGDMINEKLNLEYLSGEGVGLGADGGYTVHVLEKAVDGGTLYAELLTDHDQGKRKRDSDYLAGGAWMLIPDSGKAEDFRTGVFADGGNLFEAGISRHLSGEVTYEGKALGFHTMAGDSRMTQRLTGDVNLTANFGDKEDGVPQMVERGWLQGTLSNIKLNGEAPSGSTAIILPRISMPRSDAAGQTGSNEFRANPTVIATANNQVLGRIGDQDYSGTWGAAFYGKYVGSISWQINSHDDTSEFSKRAFDENLRPTGLAGIIKGAGGNGAFVASFIAKEN